MDTPKLNILLLGPPEVMLEGKPVLIKRRLNRALFFYLAAQQHPVTREEICSLFWPDTPEEHARKNLREALSRIRTTIGIHDLLISEGEQISLNPTCVQVDYREMDAIVTPLMSSSEMAGSALIPDWMVEQLKQAMTLCRSDRFMQGINLPDAIGFENWLELNNQSYRYAMIKVIDRLVDHYISSGNLEEALIWLGKAVHINPFDEDWNYLTLICLRDTGRLPELISFANYLEKLYGQQEEDFPQRFAELKKEALENNALGASASTDWPIIETAEAPFISRVDELEKLNRALRRRGVVLIRGEEGIGKTRLLKQFYLSQPFMPRLFYCSSHPLAKEVPFYALGHPLRTQVLESDWLGLDQAERQILSDFYHNILQNSTGRALPGMDGEMLPVLEDAFFALLKLLRVAATRRPPEFPFLVS